MDIPEFIDEIRSYTYLEMPIADVVGTIILGICVIELFPETIHKNAYWGLIPASVLLNTRAHKRKKEMIRFLKANPFIIGVLVFCVVRSLDVDLTGEHDGCKSVLYEQKVPTFSH